MDDRGQKTALRERGQHASWSHFFVNKPARFAVPDSTCIVDPEFDADAYEDELTGEPLDYTLHNTGRTDLHL